MSSSTTDRLRRAERYLAAMGPAVEGQGGDRHTYNACRVGLGFDLSESEFLPLLLVWNRSCQPPWDERQLERKLASAYRRSTRERGGLIKEQRGEHDPSPPRRARPPQYPPQTHVEWLWSDCRPAGSDPAVRAWMTSRGLDFSQLGPQPAAVIRAIRPAPPAGMTPSEDIAECQQPGRFYWPAWAACGSAPDARPWYATRYRAVIPLFDAHGQIRSVKARAISDGPGPKSIPPRDHDVARLVMANPTLAYVLHTGAWPERVPPEARVVYAGEGEPDYLSLVQAVWGSKRPLAGVLGYFSGSFSFELFRRLPAGTRMIVYSQLDAEGQNYLARLRETFAPVLLERRIELHEPKRRSDGR